MRKGERERERGTGWTTDAPKIRRWRVSGRGVQISKIWDPRVFLRNHSSLNVKGEKTE